MDDHALCRHHYPLTLHRATVRSGYGYLRLISVYFGKHLAQQPFASVDPNTRALDMLTVQFPTWIIITPSGTLHPIITSVVSDL
jgi:hypothetical protein